MSLNANQQALLNSLMYAEKSGNPNAPLQDNCWDNIWSTDNWAGDRTLGEVLSAITPEMLDKMDANSKPFAEGDHTSGADWAATLRAIKADKTLCALKCANMDSYTEQGSKSVCFLSPDGADAYVVFKGTGTDERTGETEWADNIAGLDQVSTRQQQEAAQYVNEIHARYPNAQVRTTGHSKGGNKAQYAAIMCPFVVGCMSFDGQGFGPAFLEAYGDKIKERQHLITAYNQSNDFVSPLMFPIAGTIFYLNGANPDEDFAKYHALATLFVRDADGNFVLASTDGLQSALSREIGEFTRYLVNAANQGDLTAISDLLQQIIPSLLDGDLEAAMGVLFRPENASSFGTLVAYLSSYGGTDGLLAALAPLIPWEFTAFISAVSANFMSATLIEALVAAGLSAAFIALLVAHGDWMVEVFRVVSEKRGQISYSPTMQGGYAGGGGSSQKKRDFTAKKRAELLGIVAQVEAEPWFDPTTWDVRYRAERFFHHLTPANYQNNIKEYYRRVIDVDGVDAGAINSIFDEAIKCDFAFAARMDKIAASVRGLRGKVQDSLTL